MRMHVPARLKWGANEYSLVQHPFGHEGGDPVCSCEEEDFLLSGRHGDDPLEQRPDGVHQHRVRPPLVEHDVREQAGHHGLHSGGQDPVPGPQGGQAEEQVHFGPHSHEGDRHHRRVHLRGQDQRLRQLLPEPLLHAQEARGEAQRLRQGDGHLQGDDPRQGCQGHRHRLRLLDHQERAHDAHHRG